MFCASGKVPKPFSDYKVIKINGCRIYIANLVSNKDY